METLATRPIGTTQDWVEVFRPFSFTASIIPVLLAAVVAGQHGYGSGLQVVILLGSVLALHGGANVANEYFDHRHGLDCQDEVRPSKVLVEGRIAPWRVLLVAKTIMGLFIAGAVTASWVTGFWGLPLYAIIGVGGGYFYTAPPVHFKYRGLGIPCVFLLFGVLLTQASFYFLTGILFDLELFWLSLPVAFLVAAILQGNDLRDLDLDRDTAITTAAGLLGRKRGSHMYRLLVFIPYALAALCFFLGYISEWSGALLFTLPLAVANCKRAGKKGLDVAFLDVLTARLHLVFGVCWVVAVLL